jgi:hypothetical protein
VNGVLRPLQMPGHRTAPPLRTALLLASFVLTPAASRAAEVSVALECPPVLATRVLAEEHRGWSIYSNDPLRLTGADIAYVVNNEGATLNPDATRYLSDENLSEVQIFRLAVHPEVTKPWLVCHYGVHAELSRELPRGAVECKIVQHQRFGPQQFEFEASCR